MKGPIGAPRPVPEGVLRALRGVVGEEGVLTSDEARLAYEADGMTSIRGLPDFVVSFRSVGEVGPVVRILDGAGIPFTARGAGTGLAGGAVALKGGAVLSLSRLRRIAEVDRAGAWALVEAGVVNSEISRAAAPFGLCFAPDPSSQSACTIGGNVAANSGGPHTLKYGVTTDHILGVEAVLPDGRSVILGGPAEDAPGLDLRGLLVGSEGTLAVVTRAWVRLVPVSPAVRTVLASFPEFEDAIRAVSAVIADGMVPAAMELMDRRVIRAVEENFHLGLSSEAGAILIVELDGQPEGIAREAARVAELARAHRAFGVDDAETPERREALWQGRKKSTAALGRIAPAYATHDVVVPRTLLPQMAGRIRDLERKFGLRIGFVAHAGDGNLHPLVLYDNRNPSEVKKVHGVADDIARAALELGGTVTGEHGVGAEKVHLVSGQFGPVDLGVMRGLKGYFDPRGMANPGKVFPGEGGE